MLPTLFDALSLLYLLRTFAVLGRLFKGWRGFWDADVTLADRRLANDLAFFVLIPLGVLLHESGHAVATWQVGGQVVDFQWRVFWGYIIPSGVFTQPQTWWIAFSGNLASIGLGLLPVALLPLVQRGIGSEILYAFTKQQLRYALVWYPLFTLIGFGDWVTIYDFSIVPYAQVTLAAHILLVLALLQLDRSRWAVLRRIGREPQALETWRQLEAEAQSQPASAAPQVKLALFFDGQGEQSLARQALKRAERLDPNDPSLKVAQASLAFAHNRYREAQPAAEAALARSLAPGAQAHMHRILAFVHMEAGQRPEAISHFDQALRLQPDEHNLYYWRAVVKRSLGRRQEAESDFTQALRFAPDPASQARVQRELETTRQTT